MISVQKLVDYIFASQLPPDQKVDFTKIVQLADEVTKKKIYFKVKQFNEDLQKIESGKMPLSDNLKQFVHKETARIKHEFKINAEAAEDENDFQEAEKELETLFQK